MNTALQSYKVLCTISTCTLLPLLVLKSPKCPYTFVKDVKPVKQGTAAQRAATLEPHRTPSRARSPGQSY